MNRLKIFKYSGTNNIKINTLSIDTHLNVDYRLSHILLNVSIQ